jgi:gliding motility-associated-like protein
MQVPLLVSAPIGIKNTPTGTVPSKVFCGSGTVVVIPTSLNSGGIDAYTYQWQTSADNNNFTNIPNAIDSIYTSGVINSSTYLRRIVISTNQQVFSNSVFIKINTATKPVITASGPLNLTQSGSVTLTASAASGYLWSTAATTQSILVNTAGGYTVTITDANGCTATSDLTAIKPPPSTTINASYIIGAITNPPKSGVQVTGLPGAKLNYYILSSGITLIPVPYLPNIIGVYTYYVSQTVNGYESVLVPYTVTMLSPNKAADVQKLLSKPAELQADGSFLVTFTIVSSNLRSELLDSVKIKDDLTKVFPIGVKFEVASLKASGKLIANELYIGVSQIELLSDGSQLPGLQKDSIQLVIRMYPNGFSGQLNNTAVQIAKSPYGTFTVTSNDPVAGDGIAQRIPTKFAIPAVDIFIPSGFSPNRDGVNDLFVITRPFNTTINLEIFNRWGNLVYKSPDYKNEWNGKGNQPNNILGEDLPNGTYYYIVLATDQTTGTTRKFAGFITLKR